jgi:hypothetical protein
MPNNKKPIDEQLVALHFLWHSDYEERLVAALTRAKVKPAVIEEIVSAESERRATGGRVMGIAGRPAARSFEIQIDGWLIGQHRLNIPEYGVYRFRFRDSETEFLAEARRAQSSNLTLNFSCYLRKPSSWNFIDRLVNYGVDTNY